MTNREKKHERKVDRNHKENNFEKYTVMKPGTENKNRKKLAVGQSGKFLNKKET